LHLPKRARGLVLGCLMMVAGPATAVLITAPSQGVAASASLVRSSIGEVDRLTNVIVRPMMLRVREPILPSAYRPKPPAPRIHLVHGVGQRNPAFVVPKGLSVSQAQVVADITAAALRYGVSASLLLQTANCESHFHWNSVNPSGPYIGVFQFLTSTFVANGGTAASIWDPVAQANIAAKMFARGQSEEWSCA
jgi:transglycosylase-like protein with SLT domain